MFWFEFAQHNVALKSAVELNKIKVKVKVKVNWFTLYEYSTRLQECWHYEHNKLVS